MNVVNANYSSGTLSANLEDVSNSFNNQYSVEVTEIVDEEDMIQANLRSGETLYADEQVFFIQANLTASVGVFLEGNVSLSSNIISLSGTNYTAVNSGNVFIANTDNTAMTEKNPKVVTIFGTLLNENAAWVVSNIYNNLDVDIPDAQGDVTSDNSAANIDLYIVKGGVQLTNYRSHVTSTNPISGNPFITSVPSYIDDVTFNADSVSINDNISGNGLVYAGNILKDVTQINRNFVYNGNVVARSCNIAPEYHLFVFGNTKENERANIDLSSAVVNANSFIANAWSSSLNPSVRIVYDDNNVPNSLFLDDELAKSLPTYKLVFNDWVGKSVISDAEVTFSPNISLYGNVNDVNANIADMDDLLTVLDNNPHLKQLCLENVLYTEYTIDENAGKSWTDQGNVCSLDSSNYTYHAVLPQYGNIEGNLTISQSAGVDVNDTFLNVIASFSSYDTINATDVHKLTVYDMHYKSYVSAVKRPGSSDLDNDMTYYSNGLVADEISANVFMNDDYNSELVGNISAQTFLTYTYSDMSDTSPAEVMYPFFKYDDTVGLANRSISTDADKKKYLFPGFKYNNEYEFFSYKTATDCDFQIDTSVNVSSIRNFRVFAVDESNSTVKISLDNGPAKTLPLRPIRLGNRTIDTDVTAMNWYSYITVFLTNSAGRRDYMVLLFRLKDDDSSPDDVPTTLPDSVKNFLPVSVHVKPVGSWNTDKVKFTVAHRAYDASGDALPQYTSESDYSAEVDINTFYSPVVTDSTSATISVNVFSQPINNLIVTMQFLGSTVQDFATYSRTDYDLSEEAIEGSNLSGLLADSNNNNTDEDVVDSMNGNYLNIPAYSTRYYLDGTSSGVYFDRPDNVDLSDSFTVKVYRSASYTLYRDEEEVALGLLTRTNDADNKIDLIVENLSTSKSGFKLSLTHNLVDLCARLHLQSINTLEEQDNNLEFIIQTKADNLNLNVASFNPVTQAYIRVERVISDLPADEDIDLSDLFESELPTISLSSIRGYPYHLDVALSGENGAVTTSNIASCIFKLRLVLDNYTLYRPSNGKVLNGGNRCVFTTETSPSTNVAYDFNFDYSDISISSEYTDLPSTITRLATYFNDGLGHVSYIVEDFVGHYNSEEALETSSVPASTENTGELSNNLTHTVNLATATVRTASLVNNAGTYGFVIDLGNSAQTHRVEFDNDPFEYPSEFSGKCASILYTGTRVLVLYSAKAAADGTTYADIVDNVWHFDDARSAFVGQSAELVDNTVVSEQLYSVVLPNSNKSSVTDFVNFASLKLRTNSDAFGISPILGWAGVYINNSNIEDLKLTVTKGNGLSTTLDLEVEYSGAGLRDTEATDDEICDNSPPVHNGYNVSYNGELFFKLGVKAFLDDVDNFTYTINPSKVHFYEAHDQNDDNLINVDDNEGSILTANFLSDVVYNISNSAAMNNTIKPSFSYDLDNSSVFANGWLPVLGSVLEMKFNNKFSLGYALDCFFVVKNNTFAEFDVYEISQDTNRANENIDNSIPPNTLTAIKRRTQRISNSDKWAVSNNTDLEARSGMSFKLSSNAVVTTGDIVNVYCDNSGNENNKLSWTVTNMENETTTVFSMSSHDDERYAELLNKALTL